MRSGIQAAGAGGGRRRRRGSNPEALMAPLEADVLDVQLPGGQDLVVDLAGIRRLPQGMQERAFGELRQLERELLLNPLLRYRPASCYPVLGPDGAIVSGHLTGQPCTAACKHARFHASDAYVKAFFGANRSAKTTTSLVDDVIQMTPDELLPPRLQAFKAWECPFYCRVMTPDMQRTMVPVIYQKLKDWLPKKLLKNGSWDASFDKAANCLRLECGCRFDFLSYEMDLDKFGGAALHRCHYDEQPPKGIRVECLMRLADYGGDEVFSMTPLKGMGWLHKEVWKRRNDGPNPEPHTFAVMVGIDENPTLSEEGRARVKAGITDDVDAALRLHGKFMAESGLVYPNLDSCRVMPRPDAYVRACDNVVAIDPGIRFCGITYIAFDEDNASYTWRARKLRNAVAEDYAEEIKGALREVGLELDDVDIVIDPNAVARSASKGESVLDELQRYGIYAIRANNEVEAGVKQIRRRIRNDWLAVADPDYGGETEDLFDEAEEYALDVDANADDGEFKVVKMDDHVMDAWRYGHMHRPWLPEHRDEEESDGLAWWEKADPKGEIALLRAQRRAEDGSVAGAMV